MFIWRKSEFVMEERFKEFKINEGKIGERLQGNIRDWQIGRTRFSRDLHQIPPHLDVRGAMQRSGLRQNVRLVAVMANNCAQSEQARNDGHENNPARRQEHQGGEADPEPGDCDWQDVTRCSQL